MRIGIDFGTSFSLPAGIINGTADTLLPGGEYGIPSVFYYDSEVGVQVGKEAEYNADFCPQNIKRDIKMDIRSHDDSFSADGKTFSKKEIVGHIFKKIKSISMQECARRELVSPVIDGAVISVPAAFDIRELNFIRRAAGDSESKGGAGLKVLGFVREPVAAAIAYFNAPNAEDEKTILVYDLGGGTCDIAIVRSDKNSGEWYRVLDSAMKRIGGREWDQVLVEIIRRKLAEKTGKTNYDPETENNIYKQAVMVKHILTTQQNARVTVKVGGRICSCVISLQEFEEASSSLMNSTLKMVEQLLEKNNTNVDYIVCVGGSSNMPQVRKNLEKKYPNIPVKLFQPEKAIACGAAIYAGHLGEENYLRDICKFSYGARYIESFHKYHDLKRLRIWNIIYKGSDLPSKGTSVSNKVRSGDRETYIAIYESECTDDVYLPEKGTYIGDIRITGIKDGKEGDETVLTMSIDQSGLMVLKAIDKRTGRTGKAEIQLKDF